MILATHAFESSRGGFPCATSGISRWPDVLNLASAQCNLLPYLEQPTLFNSINLRAPCHRIENLGPNETAATFLLRVFLCPSDPEAQPRFSFAPNSYRTNLGLGELREVHGVWVSEETGAFVYDFSPLPLGQFRDGLSQTIAYAEKPIGSGEGAGYSAFRDWVLRAGPSRVEGWVQECASLPPKHLASLDAGATWLLAGPVYSAFYTKQPPNDWVPDCGHQGASGQGIFTARSYHPGGVMTAMADGSVRLFTSSTAVEVWRSLGTRARRDSPAP
jgi:prepilin-type processing-associated H-X9-DG protein